MTGRDAHTCSGQRMRQPNIEVERESNMMVSGISVKIIRYADGTVGRTFSAGRTSTLSIRVTLTAVPSRTMVSWIRMYESS